jgi:alanine racemase
MNRTGFEKGALELAEAILLKNKEYIELKGICTHYAGAESMRNNDRVQAQYNKFTTIVEQLKSNSLHPDQLHSACSAAMISYPESRMDMVRIGIMQYGFWPSSETFRQYIANKNEKKDPLRRLINWKSRIMSLKTVSKGDYIGYGSSFQAPYDMVLAIIPIGYAWGYSRSLSNQGHVLISGKRANVVGMINMNIMMVDVTEIKDVEKNDEVVLLGNQKNESITVASFGELSTQLNYELLTRLPAGIPRKIVA